MRAELNIGYKQGDFVAALAAAYGPNDPEARDASALAAKSPKTAGAINYAAFGPELIVMAWSTPRRVIVYVESDGGRLRQVTARVWTALQASGKNMKPRLDYLVLLDEDKNDEIAAASVGLWANFRRGDLITPIATGAITGVVLAIGASEQIAGFRVSADLVVGSIPAILAAIIALAALARAAVRRTLVWR